MFYGRRSKFEGHSPPPALTIPYGNSQSGGDLRSKLPHEIMLPPPIFTRRTHEKLPWVTFRNPNFKIQTSKQIQNPKCQTAKDAENAEFLFSVFSAFSG